MLRSDVHHLSILGLPARARTARWKAPSERSLVIYNCAPATSARAGTPLTQVPRRRNLLN